MLSSVWMMLCLAAGDAPLEIGSLSPQLAGLTFLQGEAVGELTKGTIYVIEFSGTTCVPCIQCIPLLAELQKAHGDVVIISVYSEDEADVRRYLDKQEQPFGFRVAADPDSTMWDAWSDPACQEAIPHAFIVGRDGRIAWIGHPAEIAAPLGEIVAGAFDPRGDVMRLKVEQGVVLRQRLLAEREVQGLDEYNRINELIIGKQLPQALDATERALVAYSDCPRAAGLLKAAKFYTQALLPDKREDAVALALELAIDARSDGSPAARLNTASTFLNALEATPAAERDGRLADLALALLRDEMPPVYAAFRAELQGMAYHFRGDIAQAAESIRKAIAAVEKQGSGGDDGEVQRLRELLETYSQDRPAEGGKSE